MQKYPMTAQKRGGLVRLKTTIPELARQKITPDGLPIGTIGIDEKKDDARLSDDKSI